MYFPSIRDKWITALLWSISLLGILTPLSSGDWITAFMMFLFATFLLTFWFRTGYKIEGNEIIIFYGLIRQRIRISEIQYIKKSRHPITSPALSLKRIQIFAGKYNVVAVSPKNKEVFISKIKELNPEIVLDEQLLINSIE